MPTPTWSHLPANSKGTLHYSCVQAVKLKGLHHIPYIYYGKEQVIVIFRIHICLNKGGGELLLEPFVQSIFLHLCLLPSSLVA